MTNCIDTILADAGRREKVFALFDDMRRALFQNDYRAERMLSCLGNGNSVLNRFLIEHNKMNCVHSQYGSTYERTLFGDLIRLSCFPVDLTPEFPPNHQLWRTTYRYFERLRTIFSDLLLEPTCCAELLDWIEGSLHANRAREASDDRLDEFADEEFLFGLANILIRLSADALVTADNIHLDHPVAFLLPPAGPTTTGSFERTLQHCRAAGLPNFHQARTIQLFHLAHWAIDLSYGDRWQRYEEFNDVAMYCITDPQDPWLSQTINTVQPNQQSAVSNGLLPFYIATAHWLTQLASQPWTTNGRTPFQPILGLPAWHPLPELPDGVSCPVNAVPTEVFTNLSRYCAYLRVHAIAPAAYDQRGLLHIVQTLIGLVGDQRRLSNWHIRVELVMGLLLLVPTRQPPQTDWLGTVANQPTGPTDWYSVLAQVPGEPVGWRREILPAVWRLFDDVRRLDDDWHDGELKDVVFMIVSRMFSIGEQQTWIEVIQRTTNGDQMPYGGLELRNFVHALLEGSNMLVDEMFEIRRQSRNFRAGPAVGGVPQQAVQEELQQTEHQTPSEAMQQEPFGALQETLFEAMQQAAPETMQQPPLEPMQQAPSEAMQQTPFETMQQVPTEAMQQSPTQAVQQLPPKAMQQAPPEAMQQAPQQVAPEAMQQASQHVAPETMLHAPQQAPPEAPHPSLSEEMQMESPEDIAEKLDIVSRHLTYQLGVLKQVINSALQTCCETGIVQMLAALLSGLLRYLTATHHDRRQVRDSACLDGLLPTLGCILERMALHGVFVERFAQEGRLLDIWWFSDMLEQTAIARHGEMQMKSAQLWPMGRSVMSRCRELRTNLGQFERAVAKEMWVQRTLAATAPDGYIDAITSRLMETAVRLPASQMLVDGETISRLMMSDFCDPFTQTPLLGAQLKPDIGLCRRIAEWKAATRREQHRNYERARAAFLDPIWRPTLGWPYSLTLDRLRQRPRRDKILQI